VSPRGRSVCGQSRSSCSRSIRAAPPLHSVQASFGTKVASLLTPARLSPMLAAHPPCNFSRADDRAVDGVVRHGRDRDVWPILIIRGRPANGSESDDRARSRTRPGRVATTRRPPRPAAPSVTEQPCCLPSNRCSSRTKGAVVRGGPRVVGIACFQRRAAHLLFVGWRLPFRRSGGGPVDALLSTTSASPDDPRHGLGPERLLSCESDQAL